MASALPIYNITTFSTTDYKGHLSCIIWFCGCNMKCAYCYNPEIVFGKGNYSYEQAMAFLKKRVGLLDAVVLSGGECTLHKNLYDFIVEVRALGYKIKIDTNGTNPELINTLINEKLIDFISLDFKSMKKDFKIITGSNKFTAFQTTLELLLNSKIDYEIRTTYHSELMRENDVEKMNAYLRSCGYNGNYYIQNFLNDCNTIGNLTASKKVNLDQIIDKEHIHVRN